MSPTTTPAATTSFSTLRTDRPAADRNPAADRRFEVATPTRPTATAVTRDEPREDVNRFEGYF